MLMRLNLRTRKKEPSDCFKNHLAHTNEGIPMGIGCLGECLQVNSPVFSASSCNVNKVSSAVRIALELLLSKDGHDQTAISSTIHVQAIAVWQPCVFLAL